MINRAFYIYVSEGCMSGFQDLFIYYYYYFYLSFIYSPIKHECFLFELEYAAAGT